MKFLPPRKNAFWLYIFIILCIGFIAGYNFVRGIPLVLTGISGFLAAGVVFTSLSLCLPLLFKFLKKIPASFVLISLAFIVTLYIIESNFFGIPGTLEYLIFVGFVLGGIFWEIGWRLKEKKSSSIYLVLSFLPISVILFLTVYLIIVPGKDSIKEIPPSEFYGDTSKKSTQFDYSSLLTNGSYEVEQFTYGSGTDINRPEYNDGITFQTQSVDASLILPEWDSVKQKKREEFLGYGIKELPLNGRVYLPSGEGPFPLFIIVHGNHSLIDWSDGGYAYLGNHLASRGIITVSVDENFINGHWTGDFRGREMPARAWMLLKHIELWKGWNTDESHDLHSKVDMENIILAGHSRGGEAVQIAQVYNSLSHFPENGNLEFDFNFSIKGIISMAPTDYRYDRQVSMKNVNYLSLQGSYDSDESSFWGMRAFRRLSFNNSKDYLKAGVYIHRANHSQFNSDWGNSDSGIPFAWFLNRNSLIEDLEQQKIAKFYITAFIDNIIGREVPRQVYTDVNIYRDILPDTYILTHYSDSKSKSLIEFGEDADIVKHENGISVNGNNLLVWRESDLKSRDRQSLQNYGLSLGWYSDSSSLGTNPAYYELKSDSIMFKDSVQSIYITLGPGNYSSLKNLVPKEVKLKEPEYDFRVEFQDLEGKTTSIEVSEIKKIAPRLKTEFSKLKDVNNRLGTWEVQTETYHIPELLLDEIKFSEVQSLRLVFDQIPYGLLVIDEIGYTIR